MSRGLEISVASLSFIRPVIKRGNSKLTYRPAFHKSVKALNGILSQECQGLEWYARLLEQQAVECRTRWGLADAIEAIAIRAYIHLHAEV
jgi:hypothetical protein